MPSRANMGQTNTMDKPCLFSDKKWTTWKDKHIVRISGIGFTYTI
jgi:hypothetical protein